MHNPETDRPDPAQPDDLLANLERLADCLDRQHLACPAWTGRGGRANRGRGRLSRLAGPAALAACLLASLWLHRHWSRPGAAGPRQPLASLPAGPIDVTTPREQAPLGATILAHVRLPLPDVNFPADPIGPLPAIDRLSSPNSCSWDIPDLLVSGL